MSKEYEDNGSNSELKVMNDSEVHPLSAAAPGKGAAGPKNAERTAAGAAMRETASQTAPRQSRGAASRKQGASARQGAAEKQEAAAAKGNGSRMSLHRERELRKRRKRRRLIILAVAECFVLAAIFVYGYFIRQWNKIQRPEFNVTEIRNNDLDMDTVERMKGYWTIAVFGVDARDKALTKSTNADVNIICNINMDTGEIKLVSVYRDSYLNISKNGSYNKINQAYFLGGPEQAVAALNRNLDLDITDYMTFNWKAVADAINVLGGVDVEISKAEFYYINSFITETVKTTGVYSQHLKSAGMNHLDGVQAVAYGRLRLMDTDFARTERQRKIIKLAFEKAKKADLDTLTQVLGTVFPQVATSMNIDDIFRCLTVINRYHLGETTGFPQARGDANMGKKGACVIPQTLESNVVKLHEFLFGEADYKPSSTVKNISAKISADSGMYKEGRYVESVGTEGGVIQSAKESKSAAAAAAQKEEKYAVIYVLDEDGNKVKKSVAMKTDSDGNYIEPKVNSDGIAIGWSLNSDGKLVEKETDADGNTVSSTEKDANKPTAAKETDADGNPIEPEGDETDEAESDGELTPGGILKPTAAETDANGVKLPTESNNENGTILRPGFLEETTAADKTTSSTKPSTSATGESGANAPGQTKPSSANTSETTAKVPSPGAASNAPTAADSSLSDGTTSSPAPGEKPSSTGNSSSTGSSSPAGTGAPTGNSSPGGSSSSTGATTSANGISMEGPMGNNATVIDSNGPAAITAPGQ